MSPLLLCVVMCWPHSVLRQQPIRVWQEPTSVCSPRIHVPRFYLVLTRSFVIPEYVFFVLSKDTLAGFCGQEQNARSFPGGLSLLPALCSLYSGFYRCAFWILPPCFLDSTVVLLICKYRKLAPALGTLRATCLLCTHLSSSSVSQP